MNMPSVLGLSVLSLAKLHMLEFYFDFLHRYIPLENHRLLMMDTDSLYVALSGRKLSELVYAHLKKEYTGRLMNHHQSERLEPGVNVNGVGFFPRECCDNHNKIDLNSPLYFKLEFEGVSCLSLASKTYAVRSVYPEVADKISCKGLQKNRLCNAWNRFRDVLISKQRDGVENIGFRVIGKNMVTYKQKRLGLSFQYFKRKVLADGVSTVPLDFD